jgi:hypothetical protein
MKNMMAIALCLLLTGSAAFALEKTAGFGVMFGGAFTHGDVNATYLGGMGNVSGTWDLNRGFFGAFGFFGLSQYLELNAGFLYKVLNEVSVNVGGKTVTSKVNSMEGYSISDTAALQIGAFGKYPIPLSDIFVFFPTAGADFELSLSDNKTWWSDLWIRGGVGVDFFLNQRMFLRGQFLYGVGIPIGGGDELITPKSSHGPIGKIGMGWMF